MVIELHRVGQASVHALASSLSKPHLPRVQTVQWMFYLRIDSECMHGKISSNICICFENTLVLDDDPEIRGEKSYCRRRSYDCCYKFNSHRAVVEGDES